MKQLDKYSLEDFSSMKEEELSELMDSAFMCMDVKDDEAAQRAYHEVRNSMRISDSASRRHQYWRIIKKTSRVVAYACIPLAVAFMIQLIFPKPETKWSEIEIENGQTGNLSLADGTELFLNAGSRVTYPEKFAGSERNIFLDGHIYAKVHKDPKHPFVIHTKDMDVRVLGTTFDLKAYDNTDCVEVVLAEGSIQLDVNHPERKSHITMEPGDVVHYDRNTGNVEVNSLEVPISAFNSEGTCHFFNISLQDICEDLSRRFDRQIIILDPELRSTEYFAFFSHNEGLDEILDLLNVEGKMNIECKDDVIYIRKRK